MPWLEGLNEAQREAVLTTDGPVLMLAGAGTGKTRALTTRLAHLLITGKAFPNQVLTVTFTNKAAREMRERAETLLQSSTQGWWLGTFHSLALRILRAHAEAVGLKSGFTILDTDDQLRLIKQLMELENIDQKRWAPRALAAIISRWKDRGLTPDKVSVAEETDFAAGKTRAIYAAYQDRLKTLNAADFGDLLLHCLTLFQQYPDILKSYQERFKYVLVDEYQDTNVAQYLWLRALAGKYQNIACVGDDDQSIYGWRGAEVDNILRFEKDYSGAKVIRLEANYRSTRHILGTADGLIAHNENRLGKTLFAATDEVGEKVQVSAHWSGEDEARAVIDQIEDLQRKGTPLRDMAILVRASFLMRGFEDRFLETGVPYRVIGGPRFYERQEIRDALAYLRLIYQGDDDLAFERIYNTPRRGLGPSTLKTLSIYARAQDLSLSRAGQEVLQSDELGTAARKKLGAFLDQVDHWREMAKTKDHVALAEMVLEDSGYTAMWQQAKTADAPTRLENLKELLTAMAEFENLEQFLEHVALVLDALEADTEDKVTIMTLHAAKGLEFQAVWLPAWEEGLFPSQRTMDENGLKGLEEERRLAYVGLTRARSRLFISHAGNRRIHGRVTDAIPSRFVGELPDAHTQIEMGQGASFGGNTGMGGGFGGSLGGSYGLGAFERNDPYNTPGWRRAQAYSPSGQAATPSRDVEAKGNWLTSNQDHNFEIGERVFHQKFGYGEVADFDGNKLFITFTNAGDKKVLASFVERASEV